jgi:hypothetical protein
MVPTAHILKGKFMRVYKPSNKVSATGLIVLAIGVLVTGIIGGGLSFFATQANLYIIFIMPVLLGLIAALAAAIIIGIGKVRNPFVALCFGILAGGAIIFADHFADYYITFRNSVRDEFLDIFSDATQADIDELTNLFLEDETGSAGFLGFLRLAANEGLFSSAPGSDVTNTRPFAQGIGVWIYWGVEFAVVAGFAAFSAVRYAKKPFDESANRWFSVGKWLGSVDWGSHRSFKQKLREGDFAGAGQMVVKETIPFPRLDIMVSPDEAMPIGDTLLYVEKCWHTDGGSKTKIEMQGVLAPDQINRLRANMPAPRNPVDVDDL